MVLADDDKDDEDDDDDDGAMFSLASCCFWSPLSDDFCFSPCSNKDESLTFK